MGNCRIPGQIHLDIAARYFVHPLELRIDFSSAVNGVFVQFDINVRIV